MERRRGVGLRALTLAAGAVLGTAGAAGADVVLDNGIPTGTLGHFDINIQTGGESRLANLTLRKQSDNSIITDNVLFDYFSYVDVGAKGEGFRINDGSAPTGNSAQATSTGSFTGANGNTINWTAVSSLPANGKEMTNTLTFTAQTGTLGQLRFIQYLDEDLASVNDDVFFTRGTAAGGDLQLFTVDSADVYGVSHSGGFSAAQGLVNSAFAGFAADEFNQMKPLIEEEGLDVSLTGLIETTELPPGTHPLLGAVFGPTDIVSALAWDVNPEATTATVVTTLGGIPEASDITPPPSEIPEPGSLALLGIGAAALGLRRRRAHA